MRAVRGHRMAALGLAIALGACASPQDPPPPMADSLFVESLVILHLADAEAFADGPASVAAATPPDGLAVQDSLLRAADVDPDLFRSTVAYWTERPDGFVIRYNEVLERLNALDL